MGNKEGFVGYTLDSIRNITRRTTWKIVHQKKSEFGSYYLTLKNSNNMLVRIRISDHPPKNITTDYSIDMSGKHDTLSDVLEFLNAERIQ